MERLSAIVLGGAGAVGQLFGDALSEAGLTVTIVDRVDRPATTTRYLQAELTERPASIALAVQTSDIVVVTLPERIALDLAPWVLEVMREKALWVDTLSTKRAICATLRCSNRQTERLSLNPMFAPALGFKGGVIAAVDVQGGPLTEDFLRFLRARGASVERLAAEDHDNVTAATQVATHLAIMVLGSTLGYLGYDSVTAHRLATPPHAILTALVGRVTAGSPEVYWDIQHHPDGPVVQKAMERAMSEVFAVLSSGGLPDFAKLLERVSQTLAPLSGELQGLAERLVREVVSARCSR